MGQDGFLRRSTLKNLLVSEERLHRQAYGLRSQASERGGGTPVRICLISCGLSAVFWKIFFRNLRITL